jgi:NADH pyrophosphatase NudC (nudix superfamily)
MKTKKKIVKKLYCKTCGRETNHSLLGRKYICNICNTKRNDE